MKPTKVAHLCLILLLFCSVTLAQQPKLTWYPFDTDFISARYSDSAIGEVPAKAALAAKRVHSESCDGDDVVGQIVLRVAVGAGQGANAQTLFGRLGRTNRLVTYDKGDKGAGFFYAELTFECECPK